MVICFFSRFGGVECLVWCYDVECGLYWLVLFVYVGVVFIGNDVVYCIVFWGWILVLGIGINCIGKFVIGWDFVIDRI